MGGFFLGSLAEGLSNLIFGFSYVTDSDSANFGETANGATNVYPTEVVSKVNTGFKRVYACKYNKLAGHKTANIMLKLRIQAPNDTCAVRVTIGTLHVDLATVNTAYEWVTQTLDISSLTNGTTYDVTIDILSNLPGNTFMGGGYCYAS